MVTHTDYADLVRELHQAAEEYDRGHGPLHAAAANAIVHLTTMASGEAAAAPNPRVVDNDHDEITVSLNGKELRGWSYKDESERRAKMLAAREYVEGYCDGRDA